MLESNHPDALSVALAKLECQVRVPKKMVDFFTQRGPLPTVPNEMREFPRFHHPARAILKLDQSLPTIPRQHELFCVVTRDISRGGIKFYHAQQLFPSEQIKIWLTTGIHDAFVVRCIRHNEHCYEIGAEFGEEMN